MHYSTPTRLQTLAPSKIRENMRVAKALGAINLAQGRPDFPAADVVKRAAADAIMNDDNQYSVTWGVPELRETVAESLEGLYGLDADPENEITITCGVTEGMVATLLATVERGDEVLVVEPAHENYVPAIRFCGATPRFYALRAPDFALDAAVLSEAMSERTKVLILNTPHNPTGRVFTRDELEAVARLCIERDVLLLTDEIYDRLTFEGREHLPVATLPEMRERTITTGGISKIHCVTGWRLGYVVAPPEITRALRIVHDYTVICAPTPLQHAAITALRQPPAYFEDLLERFSQRRTRMMEILARSGFEARSPEGAYYVMADFSRWRFEGDDEAFAEHLIRQVGVATVPGSAFYLGTPQLGRRLIRFAFAKTEETLDEVERRLALGFEER